MTIPSSRSRCFSAVHWNRRPRRSRPPTYREERREGGHLVAASDELHRLCIANGSTSHIVDFILQEPAHKVTTYCTCTQYCITELFRGPWTGYGFFMLYNVYNNQRSVRHHISLSSKKGQSLMAHTRARPNERLFTPDKRHPTHRTPVFRTTASMKLLL